MSNDIKRIYYTMDLKDKCFDPLTTEQEVELMKMYKENNDMEAKDELITRNLRFVSRTVYDVFKTTCASNPRFEMETLFQEGVIGLMDALEHFDPTKGVKFLTYAYYRIIKHTWNYVYKNTSSMSGCYYLYRDYARIVNILRKEPDLTPEEISERLKNVRTPNGVENVIRMVENRTNIPVQDKLITSDGEEHSLLEIAVSVTSDEEIKERIYNDELKELINKILDDKAIFSNDTSRTYFKEYYLNGLSYREISSKYGVSFQAAQQSVQKRVEYIKRNYGHLLIEYLR